MNIVISGPVFSLSGYGGHTRDIITAVINKYNDSAISIFPTSWGTTPDTERGNEEINKRIATGPLSFKPDMFIQVAIPNEFTPVGKYNIGITALCETNMCSAPWIMGINKMDLIIVPSQFTKKVILDSAWLDDNKTDIRCKVPVEVLFEGVDVEIFKPIEWVD